MKYRIGICGRYENRTVAQARLMAYELIQAGIKEVEIIPVVFRDKFSGIKHDKIIYDDLLKGK